MRDPLVILQRALDAPNCAAAEGAAKGRSLCGRERWDPRSVISGDHGGWAARLRDHIDRSARGGDYAKAVASTGQPESLSGRDSKRFGIKRAGAGGLVGAAQGRKR